MRFFLSCVVGCILAIANPAMAQLPVSKADMMQEAAKRLDGIAKKLKLSPEQIEKIKPLLGQELTEMSQAREKFASSDKSDAAKQEAMNSFKSTRENYSGKIKEILTPEQAGKWADMTKAWKSDMNLKMPAIPRKP